MAAMALAWANRGEGGSIPGVWDWPDRIGGVGRGGIRVNLVINLGINLRINFVVDLACGR